MFNIATAHWHLQISLLQYPAPAVKNLTNEQLNELQEKGEIEVLGHVLTHKDIKVNRRFCA